jgi:5-hydroxyisourate hydrolase-like protein (transthyretin family)
MKEILSLLFLLICFNSFSQTGEIKGRILNDDQKSPFPGLNVALVKNGKTVTETQTNYDGNYSLTAPIGNYELKFCAIGYADKIISNVEVIQESKTVDSFYPNPCIDNNAICPYKHSDEIIPVIYGLPSKKMIRQHKNGKISLGGCFIGCAKWYCKKHEISF